MLQKHLWPGSDIPDLQFNSEPKGVYNGVWATALVFGKSHNITKKEVMKKILRLQIIVFTQDIIM